MPRPKKIKIRGGSGAMGAITRPVAQSHNDTVEFVERVKKPPKALRRFPWPKI